AAGEVGIDGTVGTRGATVSRVVALLRGINVGGKRSLPMADLRRIASDAGGTDVATYIQSGNLVLTHPARSSARIATLLERAILDATGMEVPVVVRTRAEWDRVIEDNPYPAAGGTTLHVVFLAEAPPPQLLDDVDLAVFAPEEATLRGRELYLHLPNGMGRAELPRALGRQGPAVAGTARNWNTVLEIRTLLEG